MVGAWKNVQALVAIDTGAGILCTEYLDGEC
jgi:hypothetical protein